jgi:peptidyl-prolyl cis-trans isomerase B (cyclophilin B)
VATSQKRAKELARAKQERRMARQAAAETKQRRRKRVMVLAIVGALLLGTAGLAVANWQSGEEDPLAGVDVVGEPVEYCSPAGEQQDEPKTYAEPGDGGLGDATVAEFRMTTNCGEIVIAADAAAAPQTVNAMAFLANDEYFNNTLCHRVTTENIYVLQCGDPTASGSGGPGFALPDENLPDATLENYPAGTVAMANSGPDTAGSQFFIVYRTTALPASYTIWGTVEAGLDIVAEVAAAGTVDGSTDGAPLQSVMIQQATAEPVA